MQQLAELVGKNLYQLASLNGLNFAQYEQLVLPCMSEQIVQCADKLAQQYLMEVRIVPQQPPLAEAAHACHMPRHTMVGVRQLSRASRSDDEPMLECLHSRL